MVCAFQRVLKGKDSRYTSKIYVGGLFYLCVSFDAIWCYSLHWVAHPFGLKLHAVPQGNLFGKCFHSGFWLTHHFLLTPCPFLWTSTLSMQIPFAPASLLSYIRWYSFTLLALSVLPLCQRALVIAHHSEAAASDSPYLHIFSHFIDIYRAIVLALILRAIWWPLSYWRQLCMRPMSLLASTTSAPGISTHGGPLVNIIAEVEPIIVCKSLRAGYFLFSSLFNISAQTQTIIVSIYIFNRYV